MSTRSLRWIGRFLALGGVALLLLVPAGAAWAQTGGGNNNYIPTTPGTVDPCGGKGLPVIGQVNGVNVCGTVSAQRVRTSGTSGSLAFTGTNIALLVGIGGVALVGGFLLVRLARRPASTP